MTHYINPKLGDWTKDVILGTVLGGSSIISTGTSCYLSMRGKDKKWLDYKAGFLKELASPNPVSKDKTNRWHSLCYPLFQRYRDMFYRNGERHLDLDACDPICHPCLLVWFGDAGTYKRGIIEMNTNVWGLKGTKAAKKYFKFLDCKTEAIQKRNSYRLLFDKKSSEEFLRLICPIAPHFFNARLSR